MREIKFRVWASNTNYPDGKMFYPGDKAFAVTFFGDVIHSRKSDGLEYCWAQIGFNGLQLMQYIDLKDKNRKEIYESDVIIDHSGIGVIEYAEKCAAFRVNYHNGGAKWFYDYNVGGERESIEVIGNIYENPELLSTNPLGQIK